MLSHQCQEGRFILHVEAFMDLHRGLPQQGPGSDESTVRALRMIPPLAGGGRILDAGCGPGRQTLALARETTAEIVAIDLVPEFLDELASRVAAAGCSDRVEGRVLSMAALDFEDASFDLIWSEGAIYNIGFEQGLTGWRRCVKPGGHVVVSELSWLTATPSSSSAAFWHQGYPAMLEVEQNLEAVRRAGYEPLGHFTLPYEDWWTGYYTPIAARISALRSKYEGVPEALAQLDDEEQEAEMYRRHSDDYGYVFYAMRR
jgi:ubiquinone/menaquinone biosynthesis C-methylase UbiE